MRKLILWVAVACLCLFRSPVQIFGDWEVLNSPNPGSGGDARLTDVNGIANDDVWAVGAYLDGSGEGSDLDSKTLVLHWDGNEWVDMEAPSPAPFSQGNDCRLNAVAAIAIDDVWFAGYQTVESEGPNPDPGLQMLVIHWDGADFEVMDTPLTPSQTSGARLEDIQVIAPDDIYFVGSWQHEQGALVVHWNGESFTKELVTDETGREANFAAIDAVSGSDMWAVGQGKFQGGGDNYSSIFHFDGESWTHVPGPTPGYFQVLTDVRAIATDDVWALGYFQDVEGDLVVYKTLFLHWEGAEWTQVDTSVFAECMFAAATDDIYLGGAEIVNYDGASFSTVYGIDEIDQPAVVAMSATGGGDFFGVGYAVNSSGFDTVIIRNAGLFQPVELPMFLRGDVNGDGDVSALSDAVALLKWGFSAGTAPPCQQAADVDANGSVSPLSDALSLLKWAFAAGTAPPAPGTETCGSDDATTLTCEVISDTCANP